MRNLASLLLGLLLPLNAVFAQEQTSGKLIDFNFAGREPIMAPADPKNLAAERITGQLPQGWMDNSAWAKLNVDYKLLVEEGRRYVAMKVTNMVDGNAQMRHLIPDYGDKSFFKLKLQARSSSGAVLQFGVRAVDSPYAYAWAEKIRTETTWQTYNYFFTLERNQQPMGFWLEMRNPGELDIADLQLERVSYEQLVAEMRQRNQGGSPGNLLRNSRLPLGFQSGWTVDRTGPQKTFDPEIFADSKEPGVSGFPALHLRGSDQFAIFSEPFDVPMPIEKYTASFYVKGKGRGKLAVRCGVKGIAHKEFTATGEWQRVEVPFDPRMGEKFYGIHLFVSGDLLVDGWQVNAGDKATAYQSQLPVEVSLACPAAETGDLRVQFGDEPALVDYYVSGNPFAGNAKGAPTLHAKVVNLYGEEALIKPIALKNSSSNTGEFDFDLFPKRSLGPMRIETWVEDAKGQRISTFQELIIYRLHRPRYWGKDAPDSPFGVHVEADTAKVKMAKAVGNNWVRLHDTGIGWIGWSYLEPEPGKWIFHDDMIARYRQAHLKILGELTTAPDWATYGQKPTHGNRYWDRFFQPKDLGQFANYARTLAEHYKGVIDTYEVWNEPWNAAWFGQSYDETKTGRMGYQSGPHPQAEYAAMTKAACEGAKSADPGVKIIGINTTTTETNTKPYPDTGGADWSKGMKALNAENDCDILSYHQYDYTFNGFPGDAVEKGFKVAMGPFRDAGVTKPIWFTEGSAVPHLQSSGFYHYTLPYVDPENSVDTANRNSRFVLSLLANGSEKIFLYSMGSYSYFTAGIGEKWPTMVSEDGYLHPAAAAYSQLAWELEDTHFKKIMPIGQKSFVYLFAGKKKTVAVIAPPQEGEKIVPPQRLGWIVRDHLGNPLQTEIPGGNTLVYIETAQSAAEFEADLAKVWQKK